MAFWVPGLLTHPPPHTVRTLSRFIPLVYLIDNNLLVMTNEPSGNFVVAMSIGTDGKLVSHPEADRRKCFLTKAQSLAEAVSTQGQGAHGVTSPNGPDALFSQGSVKASQAGKALAVVNVRNSASVVTRIQKAVSNFSRHSLVLTRSPCFPLTQASQRALRWLAILSLARESSR